MIMNEVIVIVIVCVCFFVGYYVVSHAINYYKKSDAQRGASAKKDNKVIDVKQWDGLDSYYRNILGLDDNFTKEDLYSRYTHLMNRSQMNNFSDLDSDFMKLAENKKKDIEDAYRYFSVRYK